MLKTLIRELQFRLFRRHFFPRMDGDTGAGQLVLLCEEIRRVKEIPGAIVEIGVSRGSTTVFLNNFIDVECPGKQYVAVDTFGGFVSADVSAERARGKRDDYSGYSLNSKRWFDGTMEMNGIKRVRSVQADINTFDISCLGPISFCFLDVDLYRPTKRALPLLFEQLSPGGVIAVHDCYPLENPWDGARKAYLEFCAGIGVAECVVDGIGVVRRPGSPSV
jgi:O-methyltransferase